MLPVLSGPTDGGAGTRAGTRALHNLSLISINSSDQEKLTDKLMENWDHIQQQAASEVTLHCHLNIFRKMKKTP